MNKRKHNLKMIAAIAALCAVLLTPFSVFAEDEAPQWVSPEDVLSNGYGIPVYTSADGTRSTAIRTDDITWLYVEDGNSLIWFGLDNTDGELEEGGRFSVQWTPKEGFSDPRIMSLKISATKADGTVYRSLNNTIPLYVQLNSGIGREALQAFLDGSLPEETIEQSYLNCSYPGGTGSFVKLKLRRMDLTVEIVRMTWNPASVFSEYKPEMLCAVGAVAVLAIIAAVWKAKKQKKKKAQ